MDKRDYDEPDNEGLGHCDCREDNTCGCNYPNNIINYDCDCTAESHCGCFDGQECTCDNTDHLQMSSSDNVSTLYKEKNHE